MHLPFDKDAVLAALIKTWSRSTAKQWTSDNPALGQCNVTALLIHALYGGELLKTPLPEGDHFYNRIDGKRVDCTAAQFDRPIEYADKPTDRFEAAQGATPKELATLRAKFIEVIG